MIWKKFGLKKLLRMRSEGRDPYPTRTNVTTNIAEAIAAFTADETIEHVDHTWRPYPRHPPNGKDHFRAY